MDSGSLAAVAAFGALAVVLVALLVRTRAEARRSLAAAHAATAELSARVEELSARLERASAPAGRDEGPDERAYVITDAGADQHAAVVPDRVVLSATVGEPLVRVVALGHGVRRALSAQSRNRIWFEVRQEVRASRRRRRRENRAFVREARAAQRAARGDDRSADPAATVDRAAGERPDAAA